MGLSTKQVSGDHGLDSWGQSLLQSGGGVLELPKPSPAVRRQPSQQPPEPVPCPRCSSTNTKFCYYNNYNKSQPRHFCKACKRHWTKGGTLRNVPIGGGRKNKRLKTSNTTVTTTAAATSTTSRSNTNTHMGVQSQELCQTLPQTVGDHEDKISEFLYQALGPGNFNAKSFSGNNGNFLGSSTLPLAQNQSLPFSFSSLSSFESNPSSIYSVSAAFRSSDAYNFLGGLGSMEETATIIPSTVSRNVDYDQQWQVPAASSSVMDMPITNNYWNWDDEIEPLVSTELNFPWDVDTEIKP